MPDTTPVQQLINIVPIIAHRLEQIGVTKKSHLKKIGAVAAYKKIRDHNPHQTIPSCYYLYALDGALRDTPWNDISSLRKKKLLSTLT